MKSGHPLYPMDQAVTYQSQAVVFPPWASMQTASMLPQHAPNQAQQPPPTIVSGPPPHPHHSAPLPMYAQAQQLRQPLGVFNGPIQSYMQLQHGPGPEPGAAFVLPMQQLQQLHITNPHTGAFCVLNPPHPHAHPHAALYMAAHQPPAQQQQALPPPPPQQQQQQQTAPIAPQQNDSSLVPSQVCFVK